MNSYICTQDLITSPILVINIYFYILDKLVFLLHLLAKVHLSIYIYLALLQSLFITNPSYMSPLLYMALKSHDTTLECGMLGVMK
jgi:hypothetical protein